MARKEKKYHYIYKTTNVVNNKFYIGMHSTDNLIDGYIGSGKKLWYSINKYGKENHKVEILEFYNSRKLLKEREKDLVNEDLLKDPMCMNLRFGGDGGLDGLCDDSIKRIRKGASDFMYRMWKDPKFAKKQQRLNVERMKLRHQRGEVKYDTFTGKQHSEETKFKMSNTKKGTGIGVNNSQFGTCWITKNGNDKKIKKEYLQEYLSEGWIKGRYARFV